MRKLIALLFLLNISSSAFAVPSNTMSITPVAVDADTIRASDENTRNNEISTKFNAHTHSDLLTGTNTNASNSTNLSITKSGTGAGDVVTIENDGTGHGLYIQQDGVNASSHHGLYVYNTAAQTSAPLVYFNQSNAGSDKAALQVSVSGSQVQILGAGNENLSNAGVWTDRTSTFSDKENIKEIKISDSYTDKLKNMKLYRYQKKCEIYGNPDKDGKYPKDKRNANAKEYVGLVLDDASTPEELIARDADGNIAGKSGTQIAEFLLVVNQELIARIEKLEARVKALEDK